MQPQSCAATCRWHRASDPRQLPPAQVIVLLVAEALLRADVRHCETFHYEMGEENASDAALCWEAEPDAEFACSELCRRPVRYSGWTLWQSNGDMAARHNKQRVRLQRSVHAVSQALGRECSAVRRLGHSEQDGLTADDQLCLPTAASAQTRKNRWANSLPRRPQMGHIKENKRGKVAHQGTRWYIDYITVHRRTHTWTVPW